MKDLEALPIAHFEPSFYRLLAALGSGVVLVTVLLALTSSAPGIGLGLSLFAMTVFAAIVMHEVGRLLDDESGDEG